MFLIGFILGITLATYMFRKVYAWELERAYEIGYEQGYNFKTGTDIITFDSLHFKINENGH